MVIFLCFDLQFGVCLHETSADISLYCNVQSGVWLAEMSVDISLCSLAFVRARYVCGHNLSLYCDYCDVQFGVWLSEMCMDIFLYCDVQSGFCPC